ncbi:hypothetical protein ACFVFH_25705 [Streptomyces sp. NPDC057697]|uniref:hypothetical protein n=1 Tax=Streptomyces sp. NPDC057697 TaxID=3346219 RepID=UPI00367B9FA3
MSDAKRPQLSAEEQRAQDRQNVRSQLIATDVDRQVHKVMDSFGSGRSGTSGRTSFEGHELNAMIDLIEDSDPEHLENAGAALLKARTAIKDAAKELGDFIKAVDWEGESGTAFRDWGNGLVAHATKLGDFAEAAGTQITVAGTGLASVRNSLPPRDSRLVRTSVDDFGTPKRIDGNPEYAAAVKVEKDRQEAINQANRLASYYAVSQETLAAQEPPRFDERLDVAMPRPQGWRESPDSESSPTGSEEVRNGTPRESSEHAATGSTAMTRTTRADGRAAIEALGTAPAPDRTVSTEIDGVTVPRSPVTVPDASPIPSTTGPSGPSAGPNPPVAPGFVQPVADGSRRPTTSTGSPRARGGRPGKYDPTNSGPVANGRTGVPGGGGHQSPVVGRPGATGGRTVPRGQSGTPGPPGPPVGRTNGIVGGTPQRAVPGTGTPAGPRGVPRGGVIGAGGPNSRPRPGGRGAPGSNGVVGTPRRGAVGPGSARGFTAGGTGLGRGPAGRRDSGDDDQNHGMPRPDYLKEDGETWEAGRRGAVPPVID